jgi:hypothetical protein
VYDPVVAKLEEDDSDGEPEEEESIYAMDLHGLTRATVMLGNNFNIPISSTEASIFSRSSLRQDGAYDPGIVMKDRNGYHVFHP